MSNHWYRNRRSALRAERGNACEKCKKKLEINEGQPNLQFAHLRPTGLNGEGRGSNHRILDILRNPDCYVLLCPDCHFLLDQAIEG